MKKIERYYSKDLIKAIREKNIEKVITLITGEENLEQDAVDIENLSINTAIYMKNMFEFDDFTIKVNNIIHRAGEKREYNWQEIYEGDVINLLKEKGIEVEEERIDNTYNFDNDLINQFNFLFFDYNGEWYILFRYHLGGDIRGNYANTICLKISDMDYLILGTGIEGNTDNNEFEGSYQIEETCHYNKNKKQWLYNDIPIRLYTPANGF